MRHRIVIKKRFYVLMALLLVALFFTQRIRLKNKLAQQEDTLTQLDRQIEELQTANATLSNRIAQADSPEVIERTAREQLGWVSENEILFVEEQGD